MSIRERRIARGWTQDELARRTGVPQQVISQMERKLPTILKALGIEGAL